MKKLLIAFLSMLMTASLAVVVTGCGGGGTTTSSSDSSTTSGSDSSTTSSSDSSIDIAEVFTVTFDTDGGNAIASQEIVEGQTATRPNDPEKTGHTFAGWKNGTADWSFDTPITGNITLTAMWTVNEYDIKFVVDGVETTQNVAYGATPVFDGTPTKEATAEWTYNFTGWTPAIEAVTGEATYTAQFEQVKRSYTIKFVVDGVESTQTLEYGAMPVEPTNPEKETTAEFTYTFAGWDKEITTVTGEETYTAQFDEVKRSYTITFIVDGAETSSSVEYGETPAYEGTPAKEATAEWTYNFTGWTPAIEAVTGAATYTAQFEAVKRSYTVTFVNYNDEVLQTETVEYGVLPTEPADPTRDADAQYTYTFMGWDSTVAEVTGDVTYKAVYSEALNEYTITFVDENDEVIDTQTLAYGATPVVPASPEKEDTAEWDYTFAGWTPAIAEVTGEATYKATYTQVKQTYTITFNSNGGSAVAKQTVEYGAKIERPADPTWEGNDEEFIGWFVNGVEWDFETTITGDVELKAEWKSSDIDDNWNDKEELA